MAGRSRRSKSSKRTSRFPGREVVQRAAGTVRARAVHGPGAPDRADGPPAGERPYRNRDVGAMIHEDIDDADAGGPGTASSSLGGSGSEPYFEVLVVDDGRRRSDRRATSGRACWRCAAIDDDVRLRRRRRAAVSRTRSSPRTSTTTSRACVLRYSFPVESRTGELRTISGPIWRCCRLDGRSRPHRAGRSAELLKSLRPELDLFLVTDDPVGTSPGTRAAPSVGCSTARRTTSSCTSASCRGIHERFETPFFAALREYSQKPTGVFHALPISRGKSITKSHWIRDMGQFYGDNIFLAETSATTGGLDSLLQPHGPIKGAQEMAARAFGARQTFFVTNGTSTANKIVMQALMSPGDIVLRVPRLPQVASLRADAGRRLPGLHGSVPAAASTRCTARCRCARSSGNCWSSTSAASWTGCAWCCSPTAPSTGWCTSRNG